MKVGQYWKRLGKVTESSNLERSSMYSVGWPKVRGVAWMTLQDSLQSYVPVILFVLLTGAAYGRESCIHAFAHSSLKTQWILCERKKRQKEERKRERKKGLRGKIRRERKEIYHLMYKDSWFLNIRATREVCTPTPILLNFCLSIYLCEPCWDVKVCYSAYAAH